MRLPQFTTRDLMWLTVAVGLALGLWMERKTALLWQGRGEAAFRALDDAEMKPNWYEDRLIVHPFSESTNERYAKLYYGLERPD